MTASLPMAQMRAAMNGMKFKQAGVIFCVDGTAYPGCPGFPPPGGGFSSDMAYGLMDLADGIWSHIFIPYPAATVPMWPSVQIGRQNLIVAIQQYAMAYKAIHGSYDGMVIVLTGYSQGAMVTDQVWVLDILSNSGVLHDIQPYVWRMYNYGDIFRTPGICRGNTLAGMALPKDLDGVVTGGIGGNLDLTVEQSNVISPIDGKPVVVSCNNDGDIYGCCPVGSNPWTEIASAGYVGHMFFKILMQPGILDIIEVPLVITKPIGAVQEMINGLKFAGEGMNAPHWKYAPQMQACINEMVTFGQERIAA